MRTLIVVRSTAVALLAIASVGCENLQPVIESLSVHTAVAGTWIRNPCEILARREIGQKLSEEIIREKPVDQDVRERIRLNHCQFDLADRVIEGLTSRASIGQLWSSW